MNKTILVIEDEESIREYMCYLLEKNGYRVVEAKNGVEGLEHFSRKNVDLVVTDMIMPGGDGSEIMAAMRKAASTVPVIAVSGAMSFKDLVVGAGKGGADAVIQKPFTESDFLKTIRECMEIKRG
jgi:DNA-binding response OmpR family regulator